MVFHGFLVSCKKLRPFLLTASVMALCVIVCLIFLSWSGLSALSEGGPHLKRDLKCAVLMHGRERALRATIKSIKENVVDACDGHVFAALHEEEGTWLQDLMESTFGDRLKGLSLEVQPSAAELVEELKKSPEFTTVLKRYKGELWVSPFGGNYGTLWMYYWQDRAFKMMQKFESENKFQYDWVVAVRPDAKFELPLPPLELLEEKERSAKKSVGNGLWAMMGEENGGVNDRFGIVPRKWAPVYFGRWHALTRGGLKKIFVPFVPYVNSEVFLDRFVRHNGGKWRWFPPIGYVHCPLNVTQECSPHHPCWWMSIASCREGNTAKYPKEKEKLEDFRKRWRKSGKYRLHHLRFNNRGDKSF